MLHGNIARRLPSKAACYKRRMRDAEDDDRLKCLFGHAPAWVQYIAQDADGSWWGCEAAPNCADRGWYENEIGRYVKLAQDPPNTDWPATGLRLRP